MYRGYYTHAIRLHSDEKQNMESNSIEQTHRCNLFLIGHQIIHLAKLAFIVIRHIELSGHLL